LAHVVGEVVLKKLFPDLFIIVVDKDASVNYDLEYSEDGDPFLESYPVGKGANRLFWKPNWNGIFDT
jgi:hypothetical protein